MFLPIINDAVASEGTMKMAETMPLWSILPFVGILLSIAFFPLISPSFWKNHYVKVSVFWAVITIVPMALVYKGVAVHEFLHVYIGDYIPFMVLLSSLFIVASNIYLKGSLKGTPVVNTVILAISTVLSSLMGTTGAAMLMIRPFLRANRYRKYRTFMVVFFIFLVCNIGGALTPIGDPPLFIGFLHGVPFFWLTLRILPIVLFVVVVLLTIYFFLDLFFYRRENIEELNEEKQPLRLLGWYNIFFLLCIVGAVIVSGNLKTGDMSIFGVERSVGSIVRDLIMMFVAVLSLVLTPRQVREENGFSWAPILEVGYIFAGIFATMAPALLILEAGKNGAAAPLVKAVNSPADYFWATGILSSFLDNTPTYYTFFTSALGKFFPGIPEHLAVPMLLTKKPEYLVAISAGAVFFGANTYIGNAPNFMVRSIAEESRVPMPSFLGYMFKYSIPILIPTFILVTVLFLH